MFELVISNEIFGLCSLAASRSSQEEEDVGFAEEPVATWLALDKGMDTGELAQPIVILFQG